MSHFLAVLGVIWLGNPEGLTAYHEESENSFNFVPYLFELRYLLVITAAGGTAFTWYFNLAMNALIDRIKNPISEGSSKYPRYWWLLHILILFIFSHLCSCWLTMTSSSLFWKHVFYYFFLPLPWWLWLAALVAVRVPCLRRSIHLDDYHIDVLSGLAVGTGISLLQFLIVVFYAYHGTTLFTPNPRWYSTENMLFAISVIVTLLMCWYLVKAILESSVDSNKHCITTFTWKWNACTGDSVEGGVDRGDSVEGSVDRGDDGPTVFGTAVVVWILHMLLAYSVYIARMNATEAAAWYNI